MKIVTIDAYKIGPQLTEYKLPTSYTNPLVDVSSQNWNISAFGSNIFSHNGSVGASVVASASGVYTDIMSLHGYDFSSYNIPSNASLTGYEVKVIWKANFTNVPLYITLVYDGNQVGETKAITGASFFSWTETIVGGIYDYWEFDEFNNGYMLDSTFGLSFQTVRSAVSGTILIDTVYLKVYYEVA